eukprot:CAMPEP_0117491786 /NCGR_PEP_ID=MMETSP0784-20121206/18246_1 /TAXON_ID=39447 /ORGANISM="" /LENGTH=265 /DNA_ID=CAMNT_0005286587 /DNA_START=75 /DNA_END=870 /DNA_ORIENTATION=-
MANMIGSWPPTSAWNVQLQTLSGPRSTWDSVGKAHAQLREGRYARLVKDETDRQDKISESLVASLQRSISSPSCSRKGPETPTLSPKDMKALGYGWEPPTFVDREGINSRFYPHPLHLRGSKRLSKPAIIGKGADPLMDRANVDAHWEAPVDRFERNARLHAGATLQQEESASVRLTQTPRRTAQWRSQEAFANPGEYQKPWKVNHVCPVRTVNGGVESRVFHRSPGGVAENRKQRGDGPISLRDDVGHRVGATRPAAWWYAKLV